MRCLDSKGDMVWAGCGRFNVRRRWWGLVVGGGGFVVPVKQRLGVGDGAFEPEWLVTGWHEGWRQVWNEEV